MSRLLHAVATVLQALTAIAFALLLGSVLLQVFSRLALPSSPVWTEELSRFCLLYLVTLAAGLSLRSGDLVNVDILTAALPEKARRVLEMLVMAGIIAFGVILIPPGLDFARIGAIQTSPSLGWSMVFINVIVVIAPLSLIFFAIERLVILFRVRSEA